MRVSRRLFRSILFVPIAALCFISPASADSEPGISVTVYNNFGYNASPPLPDQSGRPVVGTTTVNNIEQYFDQEPLFDMYEDFIVKYEGFITSPITGEIIFMPWADDGTKFILDGILIDQGNWVDKGCCGNATEPQQFTAGVSKPFVYWFYENGGGAWTRLYWDIGNGWEIVPSSAFTKTPTTTTTSTTSTTTTTTTTTTTIPETTTTTSTIVETTTTTTEVPLATSTTTSAPETTVLQQAEQPKTTTTTTTTTVPLTTTTSSTTSTTTTTVPATTTTIPITPEITKEEAVAVATNPEVVKTLTAEQATEVFATIDVEELTEEQAEQLVAAVQEAPQEVREAFEEEVNVFSGAVDTYVPVGSSVPISTRRVIIGVSAVVIFSAPPTSRRQ